MRNSIAQPLALTLVLAAAVILPAPLRAQPAPGPRGPGGPPPQGTPPRSGQPVSGLSGAELQAFDQGRAAFTEINDVPDGLGPRFNLDSCVGCHAQPAPGGTSPAVNPQFRVAAKFGAVNQTPAFLALNGPVRVARFKRAPDGTPDGGVHDLFVITGRSDAPQACQLRQPDFSNQQNLSLRIPTPAFGLGLVEAITDSALRANLAANAARKQQLGIRGRFNTSGNDGTITRFGWKAQNKSLLMFAGEAYNVEIGVTNELFPQEREEDAACVSTTPPEDRPDPANPQPPDVELQALFMRFLAPPTPAAATPSITNGATVFDQIGCALCHTAKLQTGNAASPALSQKDVNLYSDLALHRMGQALDDGISQGAAQGDEWRTAPLWGLGDRLFLLHDGRTEDLGQAIQLHDSPGSEAHAVIANYQALTADQKQDLLNFLRSL